MPPPPGSRSPIAPGRPVPGLSKPSPAFQKPATPKQSSGQSGLEVSSTISQFRSGGLNHLGRGVILAGKPGIGKSSFVAQLPGVLFVCDPLETGILDLIDKGRVSLSRDQVLVAPTWSSLILILSEIANCPTNVQSVVLESYGAFELMCMEHVCKDRWRDDFSNTGFFNYQNGPKSCSAKEIPELTRVLQKIRSKGIHVFITAHTAVKTQKNVEGVGYEAEVVACQSVEMWQVLERWAECIIFMIYQQTLEKASDGKQKAKEIVPSFVCHRTGVYPCKNKWGINHFINLDGKDSTECYQALCEAGGLDPTTFRNL